MSKQISLIAVSEFSDTNTETGCIAVGHWMLALIRPALSVIMNDIGGALAFSSSTDNEKDDEQEGLMKFMSARLNERIGTILNAHVNKINFVFGGTNFSFCLRTAAAPTENEELKEFGFMDYKVDMLFEKKAVDLVTLKYTVEDKATFISDKYRKVKDDIDMNSVASYDLDVRDIVSCHYASIDSYTALYLYINKVAETWIGHWREGVGEEIMDAMKIIMYSLLTFKAITSHFQNSVSQAFLNISSLIHNYYEDDKKRGIFEICKILNAYVLENTDDLSCDSKETETEAAFSELLYNI